MTALLDASDGTSPRLVPSLPLLPLLPLRLVVGAGFMAHGLAKWSRGPAGFAKLLTLLGVPAPHAAAWLVTLLEVFGGLAVVVGFALALVSVPLIATLLVALVKVHLQYGFSAVNTIGLTATGPVFGPPGYEVDLLYIAALVALAWLGPGPFALGTPAVLRGARPKRAPR
jgi:putative oxidoreductase